MRCPLLREAQVKSCQASSYRKLILRLPRSGADELCSTPAYTTCAGVRLHHEEHPDPERCPFLHESLVQYCAGAPVTKFVPYSDSPQSRCVSDAHRFCEAYLAIAGGHAGGPAASEGVEVPASFWYAKNHMWLEVAGDGTCHVGIDGLLARFLGSVERIVFPATRGLRRPVAVLRASGVDLTLVFPNAIRISCANPALRAHPDRVVTDPYGLGWMFEGFDAGGASSAAEHLVPGEAALEWMRAEAMRLTERVHALIALPDARGERLAADGGTFVAGLPGILTRDGTLDLVDAFFSAEVRP